MTRAAYTSLLSLLLLPACEQAREDRLAGSIQIVGDSIPQPLDGKSGDPVRGQQVFVSREDGHCVLCHQVGSLDAEFQGNVGPALTGIGARLTAGQIRYRIVDAQGIWPDTVMPSYYRTGDLRQVGNEYSGKPALGAQQIEDIVAFLETQTN
ncbi:sulfur oxidation c-type cytochrome SoxX [Hyphomonas adhaerens]|uniref:sulfur oxidation c-type cytochrome SoxX n=1 Tax=Hyphomonas adhaerens TaxID=81029 RepID=UPI0005577142|nr:sulfur oxidation c-type cytochrome SoxX [Hyphomonas adhaerens]